MRGKQAYLQETCSDGAKYSAAPAGRSEVEDLTARAGRATALVRALVADPLAPGSAAILAELRDPARRPAETHGPMSPDIAAFQPGEPCPFPLHPFLTCLRTARRGAAAGPSGATNEHLRTLLDHEEDSQLLHGAAERLAHADARTNASRAHGCLAETGWPRHPCAVRW